ncbi:MAG TPA: 3'-5' exonuclease, partial [Candidatus Berkiella sp.]|nr:3'-5' exonuclease [Candidatus Berkiella sp.]
AIQFVDCPLLVIAGAGSGKTRVITQKIAYLIEHCGLQPQHIYAVTFTNKAASEMAERTHKLLKKMTNKSHTKQKIQVSTFHSLGLAIIKKEAVHLALHDNFTLFDSYDAQHLLKELGERISAVSDDSLKSISQQISNWKNELKSPEEALNGAKQETEHLAARFFVHYDNALRAYNAVDFDDLISLPFKLFRDNREVLDKWQNKIRYLLVDEYQDTNTAQYELIKCLCGVRQALTVVGDDDQSIYAWRGAHPENIQRLQQDYPRLQVVKLEQNYRSTSNILYSANHLISHNPHIFDKKLWSAHGSGDPIRIIACATETAEAERITHEIVAHQFRHRLAYHDYAILYRSNHQARNLEQALREQGIPYHVSGGVSFFSRTEIKDLFAYFRLMVNPQDDAAYLRCVNIPKRDIGPVTIEKLGRYAQERQNSLFDASLEMGLTQWLEEKACQRIKSFADFILEAKNALFESDDPASQVETFIEDIRYYEYLADTAPNPTNAQKRIEHIKELIDWLKRLTSPDQDSPLRFEEAIHKMTLIDMLERQGDQTTNMVQLMTLHAAKGLEFPHVYIIGWEEECLPHKTSIAQDMVNEERRLAYVGMTRAQKTLTLTYPKQRKRYGEMQTITPSRFLDELPEDYIVREGHIEATEEE